MRLTKLDGGCYERLVTRHLQITPSHGSLSIVINNLDSAFPVFNRRVHNLFVDQGTNGEIAVLVTDLPLNRIGRFTVGPMALRRQYDIRWRN